MEYAANLGQPGSAPPGASSVMPNGTPASVIDGRERKTAKIEQVYEIRIGAEAAVEWIGSARSVRPYRRSARSAALARRSS